MIGVCGCGEVGSDAILHLIEEYDDVTVLRKREFVLTYFPGGIEDLEFHLVEQSSKFFSSDIAINNFMKLIYSFGHSKNSYYNKLTDGHFTELAKIYIDKLIQIEWDGRWMYDDYVFDSFYKKLLYAIYKRVEFIKPIYEKCLRKMHFSINPDNFYYETREFLKNVYNFQKKEGLFVIDQPFPANNPIRSMKLYGDDSKAIVVIRDPRDIFVESHLVNPHLIEWIPYKNVDDFIMYYKKMYTKIVNKNILYIRIEDLAYKYDTTVRKIEDFCGLNPSKHIRKGEFYSSSNGKKYTKLYENHPEFANDIKRIESEMPEFIYDYTKF